MNEAWLQPLYDELNALYFEGALPPCRILWSRQLTRAAGNIQVKSRVMKLSIPLLRDNFERASLFAPEYSICGVVCRSSESAVREIVKHEMIHLWLHERNLPSGHTAAFRAKAREMGQSSIRHEIELPQPKRGYIYTCPHCRHEYSRRRKYGRARACGACCKQFSGGKFDARFRLVGRKISCS